jgi:hypothetical protein
MSSLSDALTLRALAEGEWRGLADPRYEAGTGMFGGWTAAILLRSVVDDPRAQGSASALTVHYLKRIPPGSELTIRTRPLGGGRSIGFFGAELSLSGDDRGSSPEEDDEPAAIGTILLAQRRPSDVFTEFVMPDVPGPDALPEQHPPGSFGERTLIRPAIGEAIFDQPSTRSVTWVRESSGRAVDQLQLAYLADAYAPRILFKSSTMRPSSTITMSVYFHAGVDELRELGDDYVLSEINGTRAEQSIIGSQARLWSRTGKLLATTEQLSWFK